MAELVYIETKKIYPHPDNPRKDLGDLTELTASIKASGILQNLTVIPGHAMTHMEWLKAKKWALPEEDEGKAQALEDAATSQWSPDGYTVIIGHRRLAAAYAAAEDEQNCYYERRWDNTKQIWVWQHKEDRGLTNLYNDLELLGYEMSDEEKAMRDGTHGIFR
ncbi:MAG: ParB N-terminal domain-containing protein [Clostridiales bacterium]|nr:ParB N-terminal domain-containing protein [Clostridiales bacterium]